MSNSSVVHRLSIEQYDRMIEAGVFGKGDRVFLWEGLLAEKSIKGPPQAYVTATLVRAAKRLNPAGWTIFQGSPLNLGGASVPEPDLLFARGELGDYRARRPAADDVAFLIHVVDSSLAFARGEMLRAYAANAIPAYWIVTIPDERIEVYTDPSGPAERPHYRQVAHYSAGQEAPLILDGREVDRIALADILP